MDERNLLTPAQARIFIEQNPEYHIKVAVFDIDGVMRGKYMARDKFLSALDHGFGFCNVVLGWDSNDQLYDNTQYTGWHTGYPDAKVRVLPETCRRLPLEENCLLFLGEFSDEAASICPRATLQRVLKKANDMGFQVSSALEYEFFVFDETPQSVHEKRFHDLKPITPGNFGYSMLRNSVNASFFEALLQLCEDMDMPLEGLHTETGPGVIEGAIAYDDALASADKAVLFKTYTKVLAQHFNCMATFMAKWSPNYPGQSGHIHISLQDDKGHSLFFNKSDQQGMSDLMRHFIAGQIQLMPEFLAMIAPTINSYTRLIPGFWAPTHANWGVDNRTCALRVITGGEKSQRVEYRVPGADGNPYLALAAAIASGLYGVEHKLDLEPAIEGNAYEQVATNDNQLPATLGQSALKFKQSQVARDYFGEAFVEHFSATRDWEVREANKQITPWQLQRYFEII